MENTIVIDGVPGETAIITCYDAYGELAQTAYTRDGNRAIAMTITCEGHDIRFTLGDTFPIQGALGVGRGHVLFAGQSMKLNNPRAIQSFRFIQAAAGQQAYLQVTPEYEIGG